MSDSIAQMEIKDSVGSTDQYSGSVDSSGINIPSVAGDPIDHVSVRNAIDQPFAARLEVSYNGGVNWYKLAVGEARDDELRGNITQIKIRSAGSIATCNYEIILARGPL